MTENNMNTWGEDLKGLTAQIIKASFNVHNALGGGFLEKVYHTL